jgi:hypothetical protein
MTPTAVRIRERGDGAHPILQFSQGTLEFEMGAFALGDQAEQLIAGYLGLPCQHSEHHHGRDLVVWGLLADRLRYAP